MQHATWQSQPNNIVRRPTGAATWQTGRNICIVWFGPISSINANMTLSTKPEVHNVSHCHQRWMHKRRSQVHVQKIWWNLDTAFEICKWTDKQTDRETNKQTDKQTHTYRHADHNTSHPYRGTSNNNTPNMLIFVMIATTIIHKLHQQKNQTLHLIMAQAFLRAT